MWFNVALLVVVVGCYINDARRNKKKVKPESTIAIRSQIVKEKEVVFLFDLPPMEMRQERWN